MNRRALLAGGAAALAAAAAPAMAAKPSRPPNFIVILCDDLGYGDVSCFGGGGTRTPAIDRMAAEGVMLTDYYAPANLCTPSRAGLLTGRYPIRTGLGYEVIMQNDTRGLPLSEVTIAEALKPDYATALIGKWHLGHIAPYWPPTQQGFDLFFGLPYSHDMKPLSLYEANGPGVEFTKEDVDYPRLQQRFYERAERFISDNRAKPFFLELALSAPHLPEYPHPPFQGMSHRGAYGDVIAEIDSIVERLFKHLESLELDRDTLVIFTSDNGPWFEGSAGGLRDRKGGMAFDGGYRVPFIARFPGRLPAGRKSASIAMGIDVLPTLFDYAAKPPPAGVQLDGRSLRGVLERGAASPHEQLILFNNENVVGIRTQRWKYVTNAYYRGIPFPLAAAGYPGLYDIAADRSESYSVLADEPAAAADMKGRLDRARAEFAPLKHADIPPAFKQLRQQIEHMQD